MVNLDDYLDDQDAAADFEAMKAALKALADAVASTNLAVIHAAQGEAAAAVQRVQASVAALSRFNDAYTILDAAGEDEEGGDADDED